MNAVAIYLFRLFGPFRRPQDAGLGDTVARVSAATGIDAGVKGIVRTLGMDCGCEERRLQLNAIYPWGVSR